ncbi:MAG: hypothetical protein EBZ50_16060 [Alphaproteobacteria bacterium]|nr:hypothetical protein [Alphaproteobacteria bacterium]
MQIDPKHLHAAKMAGVMALGLTMLAILECYAAWFAFTNAPAGDEWHTPWGPYPRAALLHTALSIVCGLSAFVGMAIAGALKDDERKRIASRAWTARVVALLLLIVPHGPIYNLAGAFSADAGQKRFEVYRASPAYHADVDLANDKMADPQEREQAKARLTPPAGEIGFGDWLTAIALHMLVMWTAAAFRLAPPITQEERAAMQAEVAARARSERAKKGVETRRKNAKAKAKAVKAAANVTLMPRRTN